MQRYFFHVVDDQITSDEEGEELPGVDAAKARAVREARILAAESMIQHGQVTLSHRIEIELADGVKIATVRFGDAFEIRP